MFQIDNSSAVAQMPSPSAAGTPGYFTDGNPSTGESATILTAEFMNMLMMELVNIVEAASISLDKTKTNQVVTALNALFSTQSAFANSKATNGYQKLQGGLILQWGTFPSVSISGSSVTFPIAFPNACLNVLGTITNGTTDPTEPLWINGAPTTTGCILDHGNSTTRDAFWVAIGY